MRVLVFQVLALLCVTTVGYVVDSRIPQYFDPNNTVTISMASDLFIDLPNIVNVRSQNPLTKITINVTIYNLDTLNVGLTTFDQLNPKRATSGNEYIYDLKYYLPIELKPGRHFNLNISYYYCPLQTCETDAELIVKSIDKFVRVVSKFTVIMGETDKPLYRPGDQVRYRFIALTSRNIVPLSEPLTWPEYRVVGEDWERRSLAKIDASERERRMKAPYFDSIEVKDPLDNILQQWKDVQLQEALDLSYNLISDATEGEWKISARVKDESEEIKFNVKHYVLPRFQASVKVPESIQPTDSNVTFSVCAAYTNGPPMTGTFDAQLCVCSRNILEAHQAARKLLPKNECGGNYGSTTRTCTRINGVLDRLACTNFTSNISQLVQGKPPSWMDSLGVFVEVTEEATGSSIVVSGVARFNMWPEPKLELEVPSSFRYGFPVVGRVVYRNTANSGGEEELEVIVREVTDHCGGWWISSESNPTRIKRIISVRPGDKYHALVLPPLDFKNTASILVRQIKRSNDSQDRSSPEIDDYIGPWWMPRPRPRWDLEASKRLQLWDDSTGLAIQVTVVNSTGVVCPGRVQLLVQSNQRLPDNTPLTLQFLSRGQIISRTIDLEADYTCVPRDNDFGHYECNTDGEIRCLEGWTGANCLTPVCDEKDCGDGGICVSPGRCECKPGWRGSSCQTCVPRKGCLNGVCKEGGDCVCKPGFTGHLCDRATVVYEEVGEKTEKDNVEEVSRSEPALENKVDNTPRLTVFNHKASLELDGDFGPELRAVAYVVIDGELASDFVKIEDLGSCSSPAIAKTVAEGGGLRFDRQLVAPGEKIDLSLTVPVGEASREESMSNTCLLSMVDVATKNFDTANTRKIDFNTFLRVLKDYRNMYSIYNIGSTENAFHTAGIDFAMLSPKEMPIKSMFVCPLFGRREMTMEDAVPENAVFASEGASIPESKSIRLRDFFPEVWVFDTANLTNSSLNKSLTVPDTLTTWEANAVCFTTDAGLWMPSNKPQITVKMPFFVEFAPPVVARRNEILHLAISVFVYPEETVLSTGKAEGGTRPTCYEVEVGVETDPLDWRVVGATSFTTCICTGDEKETFRLPMRPLRVGHLNITATAVGRRNSAVCDDGRPNAFVGGSGRKRDVVTVGDAVRRSVRVVAEGIEKYVTIGGAFCGTEGNANEEREMKIELQNEEIVKDSLRSYVAVSGNVVGRALSNLDSLVKMPTGCGEQNLVKVAPSVHVLRHLLLNDQDIISAAGNSSNYHMARKAATYILNGFDNELKYRHPDNGAFSSFGPKFGSNGSTWLTAYVFEVFSEAEKLPIVAITGQSLNAHATLASAFEFLVSQQRDSGDGCFEEASHYFMSVARNSEKIENRLQLTAHVLSALGVATASLKEAKGKNYTTSVRNAINCIKSKADELPFAKWSTNLLARVAFAMKQNRDEVSTSLREALRDELKKRSKMDSAVSASLKWWPESTSERLISTHFDKVRDLETTAYALLALSPDDLSQQEQLATMRWISQQQNENGGFYSTQDTVIALRALTQNTKAFPSPAETASVVIKSSPSSVVDLSVAVSAENQLVSHTFEIGGHNQSDITSLKIGINSPKPACVAVHFTAIYNVPKPGQQDDIFALETSVDQGGSSTTAACTTAFTTVCLRSTHPQSTGMLLVTLQLPSGWTVTASELDKVPLSGDLQKLEFDSQRQEVSAYFNGFSMDVDGMSTDSAERCFTIPLHQRTFVEEAQPGLVTARDYYNPRETIQEPLHLDTCRLYWEPPQGGIVIGNSTTPDTTTVAPVREEPKPRPMCPVCVAIEPSELIERLNKSFCSYVQPLYVFRAYNHTNEAGIPGLMYSFHFGGRLASWNTTVNVSEDCRCDTLSAGIVGFFAKWYVSPGDLNVNLAGNELVSFEELIKVSPELQRKMELQMEEVEEVRKKYWCSGYKAFLALVKKLSPK